MSIILDLAQDALDKWDPQYVAGIELNDKEQNKTPSRTEILNFLLDGRENANYLEIGVRDPSDNFQYINASSKYSVDPGVEFEDNPVDFKLTSDDFFLGLQNGEFLQDVLFDVIFVDGLHLAEQVERDIDNSLKYLKPDGFVVLHDCNPPSSWHAVEDYSCKRTPAKGRWNGTTWKAFAKARQSKDTFSCCIDTDWGIGVISKDKHLGPSNSVENPYWEYSIMEQNRKAVLNLMNYEEFKAKLS